MWKTRNPSDAFCKSDRTAWLLQEGVSKGKPMSDGGVLEGQSTRCERTPQRVVGPWRSQNENQGGVVLLAAGTIQFGAVIIGSCSFSFFTYFLRRMHAHVLPERN